MREKSIARLFSLFPQMRLHKMVSFCLFPLFFMFSCLMNGECVVWRGRMIGLVIKIVFINCYERLV